MISRIRKALEERKDQGFTLIELLVVMIIIGILAAVAIPLFLSQREKAEDSAAKADVSTIGKEIATYFVDGTTPLVVALTGPGGEYTLNGDPIGRASNNVALGGQTITGPTNWCVWVTNPEGSVQDWEYSADGGLAEGDCSGGGGGGGTT